MKPFLLNNHQQNTLCPTPARDAAPKTNIITPPPKTQKISHSDLRTTYLDTTSLNQRKEGMVLSTSPILTSHVLLHTKSQNQRRGRAVHVSIPNHLLHTKPQNQRRGRCCPRPLSLLTTCYSTPSTEGKGRDGVETRLSEKEPITQVHAVPRVSRMSSTASSICANGYRRFSASWCQLFMPWKRSTPSPVIIG